ncbi:MULTISPECIES: peptidylprolyl isomerase [unclassified Streptococcus]|uniref:peptidylprolyl isomerase n=1 Tax=unclassified Streptococcus TaxID=2608887 RepID=UPI0014314A39|nr:MULTISPECIES: peptidylprolyl isomerase [unclassified Streptococcus]MBF0787474.1 peptidyl-prolyl cis-trans isomerase [Streptococcus sp. 19428wC2_LYSM12]MCQ9212034.1 peptidyl-prolyl cis-trans isomerase [Streptococcus sp. B01]MCQ9213363.1 peptidyl-prolyl cis-trans isomerase [Streptococcus sp. O1]
MKTKKILAGAVTLIAAVTLAACSNGANKDIVTMKGNTINVSEFYERVKTKQQAQQELLSMVIEDVFEKEYGKKVSSKEVDEVYDDIAKQNGESFTAALTSAGFTQETYKQQIRANKLVEVAVKEAAEKELTDEKYKEAYEAYTPEVTAQIIQLSDEAKANEILAQAQAEGADFAQLAKDHSLDATTKENGGTVKFDSTSTTVPDEVKKAIFALNNDQVGAAVVKSINLSNYQASYYVVKLNTKSEKAADWKEYKDVLKDSFIKAKQNDANFVKNVISETFKKANVKVKDQAFQGILSQYITTEDSSSSTSSTEASSNSETSEASSDN